MPVKGNKVFLSAVEEESTEQLRSWRNDPELRKYFREYREISKAMQKRWYENRVHGDKDQVNFEIYVGDMEYRSGGYGSDALRALIKYGFNDLNLNKIWCEVYTNNDALDIYRHIGFRDEGLIRQHYFNEGKYWDSNLLSLLRCEYEVD